VLCQHFPKTENGKGIFKPMDNQAYLNTFNNAYSSVVQLIEAKRTRRRHCQMFWLALLTLLVLVATLGNDIYAQKKGNSDQSQSVTLNKPLKFVPATESVASTGLANARRLAER
jgi:hypothetical protein